MQPFSYYGGKQKLVKHILPLLPLHDVYVEPFAGGASVFWAKPPNRNEVLNDLNSEIVNFYEVLKHPRLSRFLDQRLQATLYSRDNYRRAVAIYKNPDGHSKVSRAWALFFNANGSFSNQLNTGFAYSLNSRDRLAFFKKAEALLSNAERLKNCHIENKDAVELIKAWDSPNTLFYCDPPYINTDQGHYSGYTEADYKKLLDTLGAIKGQFILSGYPNDLVPKNWDFVEIKTRMSASGGKKLGDKKRIECLWFRINKTQLNLELAL